MPTSKPPAPSPTIAINNDRNEMERIMKSFEFNSCCFIIDLRMGCFIIGYLNLIINLAMIPILILGLIGANAISSGAIDIKNMPKEEAQNFGAFMVGVLAVSLVFLILFLAFNIILLVGLHRYKRGYVKAYLIFTMIFIVMSILAFFVNFFGGHFHVVTTIRQLGTILVSIYFFLVIRSYYLKMDNPANMPAIHYTA